MTGQVPSDPHRTRSHARQHAVCILSHHPLVLPELRRRLSSFGPHVFGRLLDISPTTDLHSVSLPVASVYVVDALSMGPGTDSLVAGIRCRFRKRQIVVLVDQMEVLHCLPLLRLGVKGLVHYKNSSSSLAKAVRAVVDGGIWIPGNLLSEYLELGQQTAQLPTAANKNLSRREKEVLDYLLKNHSNKEIANSLHISESTVKFHVSNVISRFGVRRRGDLILRFLPETASVH